MHGCMCVHLSQVWNASRTPLGGLTPPDNAPPAVMAAFNGSSTEKMSSADCLTTQDALGNTPLHWAALKGEASPEP